jgi:hypothetical protein
LARALQHIEELPPELQEEIAIQIEEYVEPLDVPQGSLAGSMPNLPDSVRNALAVAGAARELQDDDEFAALARICHESIPTPPIELDDL